MAIDFLWRGEATSRELNELHAEAFETEVFSDDVWPWTTLLERHSLGWVVAREDGSLVGFVNDDATQDPAHNGDEAFRFEDAQGLAQ